MGDLLAELLEAAAWLIYDRLVEYLTEFWMNASAGFNNGQVSIFFQHIFFVIEEWLANAGEDWPFADVDAYVEDTFSAFDYEVMERAFSDTIIAPTDKMWAMVDNAIALWEAAQIARAADAASQDGPPQPAL